MVPRQEVPAVRGWSRETLKDANLAGGTALIIADSSSWNKTPPPRRGALWYRHRIMVFDTTPEAAEVQRDVIRRLGPERRFKLACQMSEAVRDLVRARLRAKHPELDAAAIRELLIFELYGLRRPTE